MCIKKLLGVTQSTMRSTTPLLLLVLSTLRKEASQKFLRGEDDIRINFGSRAFKTSGKSSRPLKHAAREREGRRGQGTPVFLTGSPGAVGEYLVGSYPRETDTPS